VFSPRIVVLYPVKTVRPGSVEMVNALYQNGLKKAV
jgi:hypothetical protein